MKNKQLFIFLILLITLIFPQNPNIWTGLSVSTSDNLDAINLNPAGLGIKRGHQFAINLQQSGNISQNNKHVYILTFASRLPSGFAFQSEYDEINKYKGAIGFGSKIYNNFYMGAVLKDNSYSVGFLYRPLNSISLGTVYYSDKDDSFRHIRYGFAIKPFNFLNNKKYSKHNFINTSHLTIGYDKLVSYNDSFKDTSFSEYYFLSFDIVPGMNIAFQKYPGNKSYALNFSVNLGNDGFKYSSYPSNPFYGQNTITSNGIGYFHYSQKKETQLDYLKYKKNNYVLLELNGYFIEEKPNKSPFDFLKKLNPLSFFQKNMEGVQLRRFIDHINELADRKSINGLIIRLRDIKAGLAKRKEIYDALINFKNQDKRIIVYSDKYMISNNDYYLISMADEIYTNIHTGIDLKGINMEMFFLKGLLDTIYIIPEIVRTSAYKTAADIILNDKMSDEMKENYGQLADNLYENMVKDISIAKGWTIEQTNFKIDNGPYYISDEAVSAEIITGNMYYDEFLEYVDSNQWNMIKWDEVVSDEYYINDWVTDKLPKIAVIYAVGGIMSGKSNPGPLGSTIMGDKTIIEAIKKTRMDNSIKAIVLRIDSGGGSVLASDLIWREILKTTDPSSEQNKPLIVSMSDVAASGGYLIASQADSIIANPMTITGSIGVIWGRLNFTKLLNRIGITFDGIQRGKNADFGSQTHLLTDKEKETIYEVILSEYNRFKKQVIDGRDKLNDINELDKIANGRIWSGEDAKKLDLVDKQGGLHDAINIARDVSGIGNDTKILIEEFPKVKPFSIINFFKDKETTSSIIDFKNILPKDLANKLNILDLIPVLMDNEIQLLMPYKITIN